MHVMPKSEEPRCLIENECLRQLWKGIDYKSYSHVSPMLHVTQVAQSLADFLLIGLGVGGAGCTLSR